MRQREISFRVRAKKQRDLYQAILVFAILPCRVCRWRLGPMLPLPDKPIANIILFGIKSRVPHGPLVLARTKRTIGHNKIFG